MSLHVEKTKLFMSGNVHGRIPKRRYYTRADVSSHRTAGDCWVVIYQNVLDVSSMIASCSTHLAAPLIQSAGTDISHWFLVDKKTRLFVPKTVMNLPDSTSPRPFAPFGPFMHLEGDLPSSGMPWWNDPSLLVGRLASSTRLIRVVNMLSKQDALLEVPVEETLEEIQERYMVYNQHAGSYTWKRLGRPLSLDKTLDENSVPDETKIMQDIGMNPEEHVPVLNIYFNDDLTEA